MNSDRVIGEGYVPVGRDFQEVGPDGTVYPPGMSGLEAPPGFERIPAAGSDQARISAVMASGSAGGVITGGYIAPRREVSNSGAGVFLEEE